VKTYRTQDVADLSGLRPAQVRALARDGLVGRRSGRGYGFVFQDLVLAKSAHQLLGHGIRFSAVRLALKSLTRLAGDRSRLSGFCIRAEGRDVVMDFGGAPYSIVSGQGVLDFSFRSIVSELAPQVIGFTEAEKHASAEDWFDVGCDLDAAGASHEAVEAYRRAVAADPGCADAHVNLGRLFALLGETVRAETHYLHALDTEPRNALAWFNLGVLKQEQGRLEDAAANYRAAVDIDPAFADAHYNLATVLETIDEKSAFRHLSTYRRLANVR
jgi:tetratricopeptide (TPR) repeat protein